MDGDNLPVAVGGDLAEGPPHIEKVGQGGLGQLPQALAAVNIGRKNVHAVRILPVPAADAQGHHIDGLARAGGGSEIGAGVGQKGDLFGV